MSKMKNHSNITSPQYHTAELDQLLRENSRIMSIPAKTVFLEPGESMDGIYYIAKGCIRHYMVAHDGSEKVLYFLSEGWFFGETTCNLQKTTELFSKTDVDTVIYSIPMPVYWKLLSENDTFCNAIIESCCYKMLIMKHEIASLSFNSCRYRLQYLFCTIADTSRVVDGGWYDLRVTYSQNDICSIIGSARVTVAKLMAELCGEGFLRTINRSTQINIQKDREFLDRANQLDTGDV